MLTSVIFDMDGVLLDTHPAHLQAWRCLFREVGREPSDTELQFVLDGRKRQDILTHFLGTLTDDQIAQYGCSKDAHFHRFSGSVRPLPGVLDFISDLERSGIEMAVATSATALRTHALLSKFGLRSKFLTVVTGDDVVVGKPAPDIYRLAASPTLLPSASF